MAWRNGSNLLVNDLLEEIAYFGPHLFKTPDQSSEHLIPSTLSTSQPSPKPKKQPFDYAAAVHAAILFANAVRKGRKAEAAALASNQAAGQIMGLAPASVESQYLVHELLGRWGYTRSVKKWFTCPKILDVVLEDLGRLPEEPASEILDCHNQQFEVHRETLDPTDAIFTNMVDCKNGLLVAWENYGPDSLVGGPSGQPIPDLNHWSNIAFLVWIDPSADPSGGGGKLKYVLRWAIKNVVTLVVIDRIMKEYGQENHVENASWQPEWPGISFGANSEQLQALLGTPNSHGVAWLLIQHKAQLGHKVVGKVTLFFTRDENKFDEKDPSLLFCLDDVGKRKADNQMYGLGRNGVFPG